MEKKLTLIKMRSYRFSNDRRLHIFFEEVEKKLMKTGKLEDETIRFIQKCDEIWRKGERDSNLSEEVKYYFSLESIDFDMQLKKRIDSYIHVKSKPEQKVIFIVGSPRSGTSFLYYLLCYSGMFSYFSNLTHVDWTHFNFMENKKKFLYECDKEILSLDTKSIRVRTDIVIPSEGEDVFNRVIPLYNHISGHTYDMHKPSIEDSQLLESLISLHCNEFNKNIFLSKSPFNTFRIDELREIFKDKCCFIHIFRNGYDVAESMKRNKFKYFFDGKTETSYENQWKRFIQKIMNKDDGKIYHVNYQKLFSNTAAEMKKLYDFLGIEYVQVPPLEYHTKRFQDNKYENNPSVDYYNNLFMS